MPKFITLYNGNYGEGESLEDAYQDLEDTFGDLPRNEVEFYEVTKLEVEYKIVKKETVKSIEVKGK